MRLAYTSAFSSLVSPGYADMFGAGLRGYATGTQQSDQYGAGLRNLSSMVRTREKDIREQENENITRMWDRLSRPSPILTKVLIWVFLGVSVSEIFLLMVSR